MLNLDLTQSFEDFVLCFFGAPYGSKSHWLDLVVFEVTGFVTICRNVYSFNLLLQLASSGKAFIKSISLISLLFIETKVQTGCGELLLKLIFR